jgi:hypothetical protein
MRRLSGFESSSFLNWITRLFPPAKTSRAVSRADFPLELETLEPRLLLSATVWTDQADYQPGDTAYISGSGFALGETVELQVLHIDGTPNTGAGHDPWYVTDGVRGDFNNDGIMDGDLDGIADGNIQTTWYVNPDDSVGSTFEVTATGLTSGATDSTTFTDTGNDSPTNITAANGWDSVNGTNPVTTINAPDGCVITKVAIKSGEGSFAVPEPDNLDPGDDNTGSQHSGVITADGTYGTGNGYTVAGLGTATVTVTQNSGSKEISHVDFLCEEVEGTISWEKRDENNALQGGATFEVRAGTNDPNGTLLLTVIDNQAGVDLDPDAGQIVIGNVPLGTYTVFETVAPTGYALDDDASRVVTVSAAELNPVIGSPLGTPPGTDDPGNTDESDFHNRLGTISWEKRDENNALQGGATFEVRAGTDDPNGALLLTVTDNQAGVDLDPDAGQIVIGNVPLGTYTVFETVAPTGYALDDDASRVVTVSAAELNPVIGSPLGTPPGTDDPGNTDESDFHNIPKKDDDIIVIGPDKGNSSQPIVKVVNKTTGEVIAQFFAYESTLNGDSWTFFGGVRLATADMDGDGFDEIITAPGPGRAPEVKVFKLNTTTGKWEVWDTFMAYASSFTKGVDIGVGDVDGDGDNDIVTVPTGGRTEVRVFYNNPALADPIPNTPGKKFYVFPSTFLGGADVAVADVGTFLNGTTLNATTPDGKAEIIVGNGPGLRSVIYVYDVTGTPKVVDTILPFSNGFKGGITLDVARINSDLIPDFIVAAGIGGGSAVEIWSGLTNDNGDVRLSAFTTFADVTTYNAPVHAAAVDTDGDGIADCIAVVQGTNGKSNEIRLFALDPVTFDATHVGTLSGFYGPWYIVSLKKKAPTP